MNEQTSQTAGAGPVLATIAGIVLLIAGTVGGLAYLGLSAFGGGMGRSENLIALVASLGALICGVLALGAGVSALRRRPSGPLRLPPAVYLAIVFAVAVGLGSVLLGFDVAVDLLFPLFFLLAASVPGLAVLAWTGRRLGWPLSRRQAAIAFVLGSVVSIPLALLGESILPFLSWLLILPMHDLVSYGELTTGLFFFLLMTALAAPIPEELAKMVGAPILGRRRITGEAQAFFIGMCLGTGFAILENMVYEGIYADWEGWSWGAIALIRGVGSVLHPLCTGLVVLGWHRARTQGWGVLIKAYLSAVGLHTLWNGGFEALVLMTGLEHYWELGPSVSIYGDAIQISLAVFVVVLSCGLWWLLSRITAGIAREATPEVAPVQISRRALAAWALGCALVLAPIGAALSPAWGEIRDVVLAGLR